MVDNFKAIKSILNFGPMDFYRIQILKRNKDENGVTEKNRLIDTFYINSVEDLDRYKEKIVKLADENHARVYFDVNVKNKEDVNRELIKYLATNLDKDVNYNKMIEHCIGITKTKRKIWVMDIDYEDFSEMGQMDIEAYVTMNDSFILKLPTKNGFHLLTKPFDPREIQTKYPKLSIHKNNCTLLYIGQTPEEKEKIKKARDYLTSIGAVIVDNEIVSVKPM